MKKIEFIVLVIFICILPVYSSATIPGIVDQSQLLIEATGSIHYYQQSFQPSYDNVTGASVYLAGFQPTYSYGTVELWIRDSSGTTIAYGQASGSDFGWLDVDFGNTISITPEATYYIIAQTSPNISLGWINSDVYPRGAFLNNPFGTPGDLMFRTYSFTPEWTPSSWQAECVYLTYNGSPDGKLDVVFVPIGFDYEDEFNSIVLEHIDMDGRYKGLLYYDPFDGSRGKFNFLRTERLPAEIENSFLLRKCQYGDSQYANSCIQDIKAWLSRGNCAYDKAMIIVNNLPPDTGGGWAEALDGTIAVTIAREYPPFDTQGHMETVHEFAHLLGLTDEAIGTSEFNGYGLSLSDVPNCDEAGCPKWCQDYIKEPSGDLYLLCKDLPESACRYDVNCSWRSTVDEFFKTQCVPVGDHINYGLNCLEGTGCYYGCNGVGAWRPADYVDYWRGLLYPTSMMFYMMDAIGFDAVDKRHLESVLSAYANVVQTYTIGGVVTGVQTKVTLTLSGHVSGTAETDRAGNYFFSGLSSGTYKITPTKPGYSFSPSFRMANVSSADITGQNFEGTAVSSADITGQNFLGTALPGISVPVNYACTATLFDDFSLHIPIVEFNGEFYWADFQYIPGTLSLSLSKFGLIKDVATFGGCSASTLSPTLQLHIPSVMYSGLSHWADFQHSEGLNITLTGAGRN